MRKEMRKSPKIPVRVDTFMFIIFLAGSTKTYSGIAGHLVIGLICVFLRQTWVLVPLLGLGLIYVSFLGLNCFTGANNLIPMEIALKISHKIKAKERFSAYITIPMWPEGVPTSAATQQILYWQVLHYTLICCHIY